MNDTEIARFHRACLAVLSECKDEYSRSYARAGLRMASHEEIRVQCLYILNNMTRWRGDEAKRCRGIFKQLSR